ncbi:MAG: hypothetical protein ACPGJR_00420 [Akkermansiaceae bacterium]
MKPVLPPLVVGACLSFAPNELVAEKEKQETLHGFVEGGTFRSVT